MDVHAFLVRRLTGAFRTGLANADPMGLVDMAGRCWATDLIEAIGLRVDQFSELVAPGSVIGALTTEAARADRAAALACPWWPARVTANAQGWAPTPRAVGGPISTWARRWSAARSAESYLTDRAFRTLYAPIPGNYFIEHVLRGGVFTIGWFVDKFAADLRNSWLPLSPEELLEAAAAKVPPGALGLMLVPYWNNVMNPYWDPSASGIMIGWTGAHGREHFYRAILEGIAYEQRLVGDAMMAAAGQRFTEYVTMGGGSRSRLWCQIVADVTGVPVLRSTTAEATCLGAGILAAAAIGWYGDVKTAAAAMTGTADRFAPDP